MSAIHKLPERKPLPWLKAFEIDARMSGWEIFARDAFSGSPAYFNSIRQLKVLCSLMLERDDRRWLHVSMSHARKLPDWKTVKYVKDLFIGPDRLALHLLPPQDEYVNVHPYCLHLWCCLDERPLPDFRNAAGPFAGHV